MGYNCAESTNFATPSWVPLGVRSNICECRQDSVNIDMSLFVGMAPVRLRKSLAEELDDGASSSADDSSSSEAGDSSVDSDAESASDEEEEGSEVEEAEAAPVRNRRRPPALRGRATGRGRAAAAATRNPRKRARSTESPPVRGAGKTARGAGRAAAARPAPRRVVKNERAAPRKRVPGAVAQRPVAATGAARRVGLTKAEPRRPLQRARVAVGARRPPAPRGISARNAPAPRKAARAAGPRPRSEKAATAAGTKRKAPEGRQPRQERALISSPGHEAPRRTTIAALGMRVAAAVQLAAKAVTGRVLPSRSRSLSAAIVSRSRRAAPATSGLPSAMVGSRVLSESRSPRLACSNQI